MMEVIDDIIVLGRAVPERLRDGRRTVCLGGWSATRGFIRVYPTRVKMDLSRWDVIRVEVERNEQDTRQQSWKIVGSGPDWNRLYEHVEKVGHIKEPYTRREIVVKNVSPCVSVINDAHMSLGIVRPREILRTYLGENPQYGQPIQLTFFTEDEEDWVKAKCEYPKEPRLRYVCSGCETAQGYHDQKILDWGFFEWMRKHPDNIDQVWENALFYSEKHEIYLFVGNQANRLNSFLVVSVLSIQKHPSPPHPRQPSLF